MDMELTLYNIAKDVAEKALNEITYEGKTLREWVEIIVKQQPCEDCISREALLDNLKEPMNWTDSEAEIQEQRDYEGFIELVKSMPSITPSYNSIKTELKPCEDCISREQTLKAFAEKCGGECACCEYNGSGYDNAENCKLIKSMPSVTPSRPRGKWIVLREEYKFMGGIVNEPRGCKCSNCNKVVRFKSVFCPNCGADMRGEKE